MRDGQIIKDLLLNYFCKYVFMQLTWDFWWILRVKSERRTDAKSGHFSSAQIYLLAT